MHQMPSLSFTVRKETLLQHHSLTVSVSDAGLLSSREEYLNTTTITKKIL